MRREYRVSTEYKEDLISRIKQLLDSYDLVYEISYDVSNYIDIISRSTEVKNKVILNFSDYLDFYSEFLYNSSSPYIYTFKILKPEEE